MNIKLPMQKSTLNRIQELTNIRIFKEYNKIQTQLINDLIEEGFDESDVVTFFCQHIVEKLGYAPGGRTIEDFFNKQR